MKNEKDIPEVVIEVGGDHGDGNVVLVKKPKGIRVVIIDFDNSVLPLDAAEQDEPEPQISTFDTKEEINEEGQYE